MRSIWFTILGVSVASALAGAWLGRGFSARGAMAPRAEAAVVEHGDDAVPILPRVSAREPSVPISLLRGLLREELARELDMREAKKTATAPAPEPEAATPEQVAARAHADDVVQSARAKGHWREQDREDFRALLVQLQPQDREDVLRTLVPAINRGEIAIDFTGPFF